MTHPDRYFCVTGGPGMAHREGMHEMTTLPMQPSARIYPFPRRDRGVLPVPPGAGGTGDARATRPTFAAAGAWYHEAAIQDADRSRKP